MVKLFSFMDKERQERYRKLRAIRRERDYQMGTIQYANRPITFRSVTIRNGKRSYMTTNDFIKKFGLKKI